MSHDFAPIEKRSLVDVVAQQLRDALAVGIYRPGDRLVERTVGDRLGVSSAAVREAIAQLVQEGLVVRRPRQGTFVREITEDSVRDVAAARIALELLVVDRLLGGLEERDRQALQRTVDAMRDAARAGDQPAFSDADEEFHAALSRATGSDVLSGLLTHLRNRLEGFYRRHTVALTLDELETAATWHAELLHAIVEGNRELARANLTMQIEDGARRAVLQLQGVSG